MMKQLMIQGTASSVGKSLLTAGLCRIYARRGERVKPFKSQNMSRHVATLPDGKRMSRIQVLQARAAMTPEVVEMNPILLRPVEDNYSELILLGESVQMVRARGYYEKKEELLELVLNVWHGLKEGTDRLIIEGAGSPAEINLRSHDLVNMGLAERIEAPVLLVGDIDRGGVFASLYGTVKLLSPQDQRCFKGFVINKFRGDVSLLEGGISRIQEELSIPCLGVIPYENFYLEEEDSLVTRLSTDIAPDVDRELDRLASFLERYLDLAGLEEIFR